MTVTARRRKGSGSIFLRGDGLWTGRATVDGSRRQVTSQRFCDTLRKFSELHPYRPEFSITPLPRVEAMRQARELGRHTAREWWALVVKVGRRCNYCGIECSPLKRPSQRITPRPVL